MRFLVRRHDATSISGPKLASLAAGSGTVVRVFGKDGEMVACDDLRRLDWKFRIIMERPNDTAASTLEHGEHELGDFEPTTVKEVVVFDVGAHHDRRRNWSRSLTLDKFRKLVLSTKMGGGVGHVGRHWTFNGRSVASAQGDLHVVAPVRQVLFGIDAVLVRQGLW